MPLFSRPLSKTHLSGALAAREADLLDLRDRLGQAEADRERLWAEGEELRTRLNDSRAEAFRIRETYLGRLDSQTQSTLALSETVDSVLNGMKEISTAYKEMIKAVHSVGQVCRSLGESFQIQVETQETIGRHAGTADAASAGEVRQAQALKADLDQLASIRLFMAQAVDTIDEVSSRLSLLSMNGRIEAAHAGSVGRGFAVVAQEMLKLQQESQKIIASQRTQLGDFLPLMNGMQDKSETVETQAREQQAVIREIAGASQVLGVQTRTNQDHISELTSAVEELAASIEQGERTTQIIDTEAAKVERIFKEEAFVARKANTLDRFLFDLSRKARTVAGAAQTLVNEYQKLSVLNGTSYVWQGEVWLVTGRDTLPPALRDREASSGSRVAVCVGQTANNPRFPSPLDPRAGILDIRPVQDFWSAESPLQGLRPFFDRAQLTLDDLKNPARIARSPGHATMSVTESFTGAYRQVMEADIRRGGLVSAFSFGGAFAGGDVLVAHFLSTYQRRHADAVTFSLLGESLVMSLQPLVDAGAYWETGREA